MGTTTLDPVYFSTDSWRRRVEKGFATDRSIRRRQSAAGPQIMEHAESGLRVVINISAHALLSFLAEHRYRNLHESPVIGGRAGRFRRSVGVSTRCSGSIPQTSSISARSRSAALACVSTASTAWCSAHRPLVVGPHGLGRRFRSASAVFQCLPEELVQAIGGDERRRILTDDEVPDPVGERRDVVPLLERCPLRRGCEECDALQYEPCMVVEVLPDRIIDPHGLAAGSRTRPAHDGAATRRSSVRSRASCIGDFGQPLRRCP